MLEQSSHAGWWFRGAVLVALVTLAAGAAMDVVKHVAANPAAVTTESGIGSP